MLSQSASNSDELPINVAMLPKQGAKKGVQYLKMIKSACCFLICLEVTHQLKGLMELIRR